MVDSRPLDPALLVDDQTFAEVLARFYAARHTGSVVIHFAQGHAVRLELPCEPVRIKLDTRKKIRHS